MGLVNTNISQLLKSIGKNVFYTESDGVISSAALPLLTASGTDTYTATSGYSITSYTDMAFLVKFTNANTASSTLNIDSVGATTLKKSGATNLASGDISATQIFLVVYDGTNWQMIGIGGSGGGSGSYTDFVNTFLLMGA